jgi:TPR repeat protein
MNSTTLKIQVAGQDFFLACRRRERFCIGSAPDCKLSLDAEGIAAEHCEIERMDAERFFIRPLGGNAVTVNGEVAGVEAVASPFDLGLGPFTFSVEMVADEVAAGFEVAQIEEGGRRVPYLVRYKRSRGENEGAHTGGGIRQKSAAADSPRPSQHHHRPRSAAIPSIRFGSRARNRSLKGTLATNVRSEGGDRSTKESEARVTPSFQSIPFPSTSRGYRSPPRPPSELRKASVGLVATFIVLLAVLGAGGVGWFAWRAYIVPQRPDLLMFKANEGDVTALATLGLSHLRGEWGANFDFPKGRAMIEKAAEEGDPCGLLGAGLLSNDGLSLKGAPENLNEAALGFWRRALEAGALKVAAERNDARWISLAAFAEWKVTGTIANETLALLDSAIEAGYPNGALVRAEIEDAPEKKEPWLSLADDFAQKAGKRGSVHAIAITGHLHTAAVFPEADPRFGREQLAKAAEAGDPIASYQLAGLLVEERDAKEAFLLASFASDAGLVHAKALLGEFYMTGSGVAPDPVKGYALGEEAAAAGSVKGMAVIARSYGSGSGTRRDPDQAIRIWRRLIEAGRVEFSAELGNFLANEGRKPEAIEPLRSAATSGDAEAALLLGRILAENHTDEILHLEAVKWLEMAVKAEVTNAAVALASVIDDPAREKRDPEGAFKLLRRLTDDGDMKSAIRLADYYVEGRGVAKDATKALLLLQRAAEEGESMAHFPLGRLFERGTESISASPVRAFECYAKAMEAGDDRLSSRFPSLVSGGEVVRKFVKSWESEDLRDTIGHLAPEVSEYFHLVRPDAVQIASIERGFRQTWPSRIVETDEIEAVNLVAIDRIEFRVPYRIQFSRANWAVSANALATVEIVTTEAGIPQIAGFQEKVNEWILEPGPDRFEPPLSDVVSTRGIFPAIPLSESEFDVANLPRKSLDWVKAQPFADKFGKRHARLPISIAADVVTFVRLPEGGEMLLPVSHFEESVLTNIQHVADGQSLEEFDEWSRALITGPDLSDPATAAILRAAESGDHQAEARVGEAYYDGLGTFPMNRPEALKWFIRSARAKHRLGVAWIAVMTRSGEIQSTKTAADQLEEASFEFATAISQPGANAFDWRCTAEWFAEQQGLDFGDRQPRELLERAIELGDDRALILLGSHQLQSTPIDGTRLLRYAADRRCATASTMLAKYYLGRGNDPRLVPALLRLAANKGDTEAQLLLGEFLANGGTGIAQPLEAAFWLEFALQNAVALAEKTREVEVRAAIRTLADRIDEDHYRRVRNYLAKRK